MYIARAKEFQRKGTLCETLRAKRDSRKDHFGSFVNFNEQPWLALCRILLRAPRNGPRRDEGKDRRGRKGKAERGKRGPEWMDRSAFVRDNLCTSSFACQLIGRDYARFMVVRLLLSLYKLRRCCFFRGSYEFKNYSVERAANTSPDVSLHVSTSDEDSRLISFHRGRGCGRWKLNGTDEKPGCGVILYYSGLNSTGRNCYEIRGFVMFELWKWFRCRALRKLHLHPWTLIHFMKLIATLGISFERTPLVPRSHM